MHEVYGNAFKLLNSYDALCITTNGTVKSNGEAVMGRGIAYQIRKYCPDITYKLGTLIKRNGNIVQEINCMGKAKIISFPVKHQWFEKADIELIKQSVLQLGELFKPPIRILLPRPGCGNGGLLWKDVKIAIAPILPDNVSVVDWYNDNEFARLL